MVKDCKKRSSGGRARAGGAKSAAAPPGLVMPSYALYLLEPSHSPTVL